MSAFAISRKLRRATPGRAALAGISVAFLLGWGATTVRASDFTFGALGGGNGQMGSMTSIAVAPTGDVYVADRGNQRIQRFTASGQFISAWSLPCVWGIAADASGVYATTADLPYTSPSCQSVVKYSLAGAHLWTSAGVTNPLYAVSNGSTVFVSEFAGMGGGAGAIARLNAADGSSAGADWASGIGAQPNAMALLPGNRLLYVDSASGKAIVLNASGTPTGSELSMPPNSFQLVPVSVATDPEGNLYVGRNQISGSVYLPARVHVYGPDLSPLTEFETSLASESFGPSGMGISPDSRVYLGFPDKGKIEALDPKDPQPKLEYVAGSGPASAEPWFTGNPLTLRVLNNLRIGSISAITWDLDGDGTFEYVGGDSATVSFESSGSTTIKAKVTTSLGKSAIASFTTFVYPRPEGLDTGVSINDGAQFTNDPNVTLSVVWPGGATQGRVANDGGFGGAQSFSLAPTVRWKIASSGSERLPKTVYVRFQSSTAFPGVDPTKTFQDDIILDQTAPVIASASLAGTARTSATSAKTKSYRARVKATDKTSGVAKVQGAANRKKPLKAQKYKSTTTFRSSAKPGWVRVQDNAGNWSRWKRLK